MIASSAPLSLNTRMATSKPTRYGITLTITSQPCLAPSINASNTSIFFINPPAINEQIITVIEETKNCETDEVKEEEKMIDIVIEDKSLTSMNIRFGYDLRSVF